MGEVGAKVRALRLSQALGLTKCAARASISKGDLSRVEAGKLPLTAHKAWALSRVLGPAVLELADSGDLLRHMDLRHGLRRQELDENDGGLWGYLFPGGVRVLVPEGMARAGAVGR